MLLVGAVVVAIVMEELWIVLAVAGAVVFVALALKALADGRLVVELSSVERDLTELVPRSSD